MQCTEIFCPDGWWYEASKCLKVVHTNEQLEVVIKTVFRLEPPPSFSKCKSSYEIYHAGDYINFLLYPDNIQHFGGPYRSNMMFGLISTYFSQCPQEASNSSLPYQSIEMEMKQTLYGIKLYTNYATSNDKAMERIDDTVLNKLLESYAIQLPNGENFTLIRDINWTFAFQSGEDIFSSEGNRFEEREIVPEYRMTKPGKFTPFSRMLYCPHIILNSTDVEILNGGMILKILFNNKTVQNYNFYIINGDIIKLCVDQYITNNTAIRETIVSVEQSEYSTKGILSLVCTSLSVLCLFLIFIIYCVFKSMRSVPGMNNMSLAVTLMTAQVLYQFGAGQKANQLVCEIIGLLTHYAWLVAAMWMNICCWHMFRIFGRKVVSVMHKGADFTLYIKYLIVCFCVPVIFVIVNIVVNITTHGTSKIGYMGEICFIADNMMLGLTFALPVGIIIIINTCLFLIVVVSISRQAQASAMAAADRQYVHVYFRLSTITGMTWVFGFLYEWTFIETFSYLFIALNASQGVLLFVAFICNKNVMAKMKPEYSTTTSSRSK